MADRFDEMAQAFCIEHNLAVDAEVAALLREVEKRTRFAAFWACEKIFDAHLASEQAEARPGLRRNWHHRALGARGCADALRFPEVGELAESELLAARKVVEAARHAYDCLARHCMTGAPIECCGAMTHDLGDALADYDKAVGG